MNSHDEGWEDFTHTTRTSDVSSQDLLTRYREFKSFIAGLSRKELVNRRWLADADDLSPMGAIFFDLPIATQPTLFRKSSDADETLLAVWQAKARAEAEYFAVTEDIPTFTKLTRDQLREVARLSVDPQALRQLPAILAKLGIILVYVVSLPGMKADGAVFRLSTGQPVVAMSLRFPRIDYFWFTLLHELAHLVLHLDKLQGAVFFDVEAAEKGVIEKTANRLARDSLVDPESWESCDPKFDPSDLAVRKYAAEEGVHPAIVAGLLRRESGNYTKYSKLINEHNVREIIFQP